MEKICFKCIFMHYKKSGANDVNWWWRPMMLWCSAFCYNNNIIMYTWTWSISFWLVLVDFCLFFLFPSFYRIFFLSIFVKIIIFVHFLCVRKVGKNSSVHENDKSEKKSTKTPIPNGILLNVWKTLVWWIIF